MKGNRRDAGLIRRSEAGDQLSADPDAASADAEEKRHASADAQVAETEIKQSFSLMARLFGGTEHTPLFVVTFLTVLCLAIWVVLAIWGPDTPRIATLIDNLGKAFTFFIGLFAGLSLGRRN